MLLRGNFTLCLTLSLYSMLNVGLVDRSLRMSRKKLEKRAIFHLCCLSKVLLTCLVLLRKTYSVCAVSSVLAIKTPTMNRFCYLTVLLCDVSLYRLQACSVYLNHD